MCVCERERQIERKRGRESTRGADSARDGNKGMKHTPLRLGPLRGRVCVCGGGLLCYTCVLIPETEEKWYVRVLVLLVDMCADAAI